MFTDARSRVDRLGSQPPLRLRWYGVTRQGLNRTGDEAFLGDVARAVRDDAIVTLAHTEAFSLVRAVDVDPSGWLLFAKRTTWAASARGLNHAEFFDRTGQLVASVSQEGLMRLRE